MLTHIPSWSLDDRLHPLVNSLHVEAKMTFLSGTAFKSLFLQGFEIGGLSVSSLFQLHVGIALFQRLDVQRSNEETIHNG